VEIVPEKSEDTSPQESAENGSVRIAVEDGNGKNRSAGNECHARGQAVKTVNQVQGIGNSHNPEDGKGDGEVTELYHVGTKREGENLYLKSDRDQYQAGEQLDYCLGSIVKSPDIIEKP
jgi:hypothetical protein